MFTVLWKFIRCALKSRDNKQIHQQFFEYYVQSYNNGMHCSHTWLLKESGAALAYRGAISEASWLRHFSNCSSWNDSKNKLRRHLPVTEIIHNSILWRKQGKKATGVLSSFGKSPWKETEMQPIPGYGWHRRTRLCHKFSDKLLKKQMLDLSKT